MDMFTGPVPPTVAQMHQKDAQAWGKDPHRNVCVKLKGGRAEIVLANDVLDARGEPRFWVKPRYVPLYTPPKVYVEFIEGYRPGIYQNNRPLPYVLTISTPDAPKTNGTVCVGIGTQK